MKKGRKDNNKAEKDPIFRKILTTFILKPIFRNIFKVKVSGVENIPEKGESAIICGNHIGFFDAASLISSIDRHIYYLGKKELLNTRFGRFAVKNYGIIPVDRANVGTSMFKELEKKIDKGLLIGIYPEGTTKGALKRKKLKSGSVSLAMKYKIPIIPVGFEEFKPFKEVHIKIGKPIYFKEENTNKLILEHETDKVFDEVIKLLNKEDKEKYLDAIAKRKNILENAKEGKIDGKRKN